MQRYDLIVVGAGPAGLSAAIEASKAGMTTIVFDENAKPGGQLFKQIHKFFGSKENRAKVRGFKIGEELLKKAEEYGVEVKLNAVVIGLYPEKEITVKMDDVVFHYKGDAILIATGASENALNFRGWTLPGVIGAGAAQTMMNLHHVKPGNKVLMVGTGNVGLVVSYQLMQAGCEVTALIDVLPRISGYGVHAAKIARCGVQFYPSHTIIQAEGKECVTGAVIGEIDKNWKIKPGTEKHFDVDTICTAVGLSPMSQLLKQAGCQMMSTKGGYIPVCNEYGETSIGGIFAAGDVSSIEEASSAMIEGRISGIDIAYTLGYLSNKKREKYYTKLKCDLENLRKGMFGPENRGKLLKKTDENIDISMNLLHRGYISDDEIFRYPGIVKKSGIHPVMECTQNIPCNPCQDACPKGCITIGENITSLPIIDLDKICIGCGMCVASCPGQAIFLVDEDFEEKYASVMIPYEFLPLPEKGEKGKAMDRSGKVVCEAEVIGVKTAMLFDHTNLLTIKVPKNMAMKARFYKTGRS